MRASGRPLFVGRPGGLPADLCVSPLAKTAPPASAVSAWACAIKAGFPGAGHPCANYARNRSVGNQLPRIDTRG
jgi:hypothetical protein